MRARRVAALLGGVALALTMAVGVSASAFTLGPLVQVSGGSPLAGCTADNVGGQSGTAYVGSEVEPWIDVNPTNPANIVGIWQQDRWSNGGARGLVVGASMNGGASWTAVTTLKTTLCTGGTAANFGGYQRATDPWVSFGPTGTVYQLSLSFNDVAPPFTMFDFDHALLASRSTNGGLTWSDPVVVRRDTAPTVFNDKQTITADPTNPSYVYAVWDRLVFPASERASVVASFRTSAFSGPAWFARSTDAGLTWEPARPIWDPGQQDQTIGNQIVVQPYGTLVDIFTEFNNENAKKHRGGFVRVLRSTDKGVTWSGPYDIARLGTIGVTDPETGDPVRTGDIIPDIAVDPANGRLYAVWQDASFNNNQADAIAFSQSLDGGLTWSTRSRSTRPRPRSRSETSRRLHRPWMSQRTARSRSPITTSATTPMRHHLLTDYFIVHCHPTTATTCTNANNWGNEAKLTDQSFDMRQAPDAGGFFTGDYEGLANAVNDFTAFFSQPHNGDPASTFFRRAG